MMLKLFQNFKFGAKTTRRAGGLDLTAIGGKIQGLKAPQSLLVKPGTKHPVWKTPSSKNQPKPDNSINSVNIFKRKSYGNTP
jgi:hypothetical protein